MKRSVEMDTATRLQILYDAVTFNIALMPEGKV